MEISALGYAGIAAGNLADWSAFATGLLGMQAAETSRSTLALRMDERRQRLILDQHQTEVPFFLGWEVADRVALEGLAARLEKSRCAGQTRACELGGAT